MPTENEFKFVLNTECESDIHTVSHRPTYIRQAYLNNDGSVRIRCNSRYGNESYLFTYKQNIANRLVEIETDIDKRDFYDLLTKATKQFYKVRYVLKENSNWTVDFLISGDIYFALAEVELPEGSIPRFVPTVVQKNLILAVDKTDQRFYNSKLCDSKYAKELLESLK